MTSKPGALGWGWGKRKRERLVYTKHSGAVAILEARARGWTSLNIVSKNQTTTTTKPKPNKTDYLVSKAFVTKGSVSRKTTNKNTKYHCPLCSTSLCTVSFEHLCSN